jgi:class 3 adenylate cyclase
VDKYLGDGFLAIFGAPVSSMNDADNAIQAALKMKSSVDEINETIALDYDVELQVGISVHTGEAVVGNIGFEMKMDYSVIGDSVNDVFRLQELTKPFPNGILISEKTLRATRGRLELKELD